MRALVLASVIALSPSAAAGDCAPVGLEARVLNDNATIAFGGGLVVAAVPKVGGPLAPGDVALDTGWRAKTGKLTVTPLAPGLAVYQMHAGDLVDKGGKRVGTVKDTAKLVQVAAPKVKAITYTHRMGRRSITKVTVEVEQVPAGVVAMVLADDKGAARSWGLVNAGTTIDVFLSRDCLTLPNKTVPSKAGESVKLMFVDGAGRLSDATAAIKIVEAP
jgi:hypothetical protein